MSRKTPILYIVWAHMKQRCFDKNTPDYKNYGGRGVSICEKWLTYIGFIEDMLPSYKEGLTLDRIDVNGGYCTENCRWATRKEQNNNTRRNRYIVYNGVTKTLSEWAEFFKIKSSTVRQRFYVYKWSIENCFLTKIQKREV